MKLIFVGGIHGAGKTTLCKAASAELGIDHRAASSIIRDEDASALPAVGKEIADLDGNQRLLVSGVKRLSESRPLLLLDGHFALPVRGAGFQPVPQEVFKLIGVSHIAHVSVSDETVHRQLIERDGSSAWSLDDVRLFQAIDHDQAKKVAGALGLQLFETHAHDQAAFIKWLSNQLAS